MQKVKIVAIFKLSQLDEYAVTGLVGLSIACANLKKCTKQKYRFTRRTEGDSTIIGTILMLVIVLIVASVAVVWAVPENQRKTLESQYRSSHGQFECVAATVREAIFDASGTNNGPYSSRTCRISIGTGTLSIKQKEEVMLVSYTLDNGTDGDVKFDFIYYTTTNATNGESITVDYLNIFNYTKDGNRSPGNMKITHRWLNGSTSPVTAIDSNRDGVYALDPPESLVNTFITVSDPSNDTPMAEAWILQTSGIIHTIPSTLGTFFIRTANGGIITDYPARTAYVDKSPIIFNGNNRMSLYIVVLESTMASGQNGIYDLTFTVKNYQVNSTFNIRNLRFKVIGEYRDALYSYFVGKYGFQTNGEHILYNYPIQQLDMLRYMVNLTAEQSR